MLSYSWFKMLYSSQNALLKLSKTTSPDILFPADQRNSSYTIIETYTKRMLKNFWKFHIGLQRVFKY